LSEADPITRPQSGRSGNGSSGGPDQGSEGQTRRIARYWDASDAIRPGHHNPLPHLYLADAFRAGFARLAPLALSFDASIYHPQLPELADLAKSFPDTKIVLGHFGGR
jgi:predicted TIM-barrel fold metal-dependent hydrolase